MAWKNDIDGSVVLGDKPYGNFWTEIADPAPAPAPPPPITALEFRDRFTDSEKSAIYTAAGTTPQIRMWIDDLSAVGIVDFTDPRLATGVNALVTAGLLTASRAAEILTP